MVAGEAGVGGPLPLLVFGRLVKPYLPGSVQMLIASLGVGRDHQAREALGRPEAGEGPRGVAEDVAGDHAEPDGAVLRHGDPLDPGRRPAGRQREGREAASVVEGRAGLMVNGPPAGTAWRPRGVLGVVAGSAIGHTAPMAAKSIAVRLDLDTLARVDALEPQFSTKARDASRSKILRELILVGLKIMESDVSRRPAQRGAPRPPRPDRGA